MRRLKNGIASTSRIAVPASAAITGCRWITRLHRYGIVSRNGRGARRGTSRRSGARAKLATSTTAASASPIRASGWIVRAKPASPTATSSAAISPRHRVTSTRSPANPRSAGSSVSDATAVTKTTTAAAPARPVMNDSPISTMPSNEITTVVAANATARPAVSSATTVASSTDAPLCRFSR